MRINDDSVHVPSWMWMTILSIIIHECGAWTCHNIGTNDSRIKNVLWIVVAKGDLDAIYYVHALFGCFLRVPHVEIENVYLMLAYMVMINVQIGVLHMDHIK